MKIFDKFISKVKKIIRKIKINPLITCNKCGFTFFPEKTFSKKITNEFMDCRVCSNKIKNYLFLLSEYYILKLKIFLLLISFAILLIVIFNSKNKFSEEIFLFMLFYIMIDQLFIHLNIKYFLLTIVFICFIIYQIGYYKLFVKFIVVFGMCLSDLLKINKLIMKINEDSKYMLPNE